MFLKIIKIGYITINISLLLWNGCDFPIIFFKLFTSEIYTVSMLILSIIFDVHLQFTQFVAGIRIALPFYLRYVNTIVKNLNYDRFIEVSSLWMIVLVLWDVILAISDIRSVVKNDREQIFENAFKFSVFGLVIIWFVDGLGDRFQIAAPFVLKHRIQQYHVDPRAKFIVDMIQTKFKCCGSNNAFIWSTHVPLPSSCCVNSTCISGNIHTLGCSVPLAEYMESLNIWLILVNFPFIEILVGIWNCLLADYLPPPEIIYQLESNERQLFGGVRIQNERGEEDDESSPSTTKVEILTRPTGECAAANSEQTFLVKYENWPVRRENQSSSSGQPPQTEPQPADVHTPSTSYSAQSPLS